MSKDSQAPVSGVHLWLLVMKAHRAIGERATASIADTGICFTDFTILEILLHKGPLPVNTLAARIGLTSGSGTTAIDRLEKRGLVERHSDAADRRTRVVHLTVGGTAADPKGLSIGTPRIWKKSRTNCRRMSVSIWLVCSANSEKEKRKKMLQKLVRTNNDAAIAIARVVLGGVMFTHGAQKMLGWFGGYGFTGTMGFFEKQMHIPAPLAFLAIAAEFFGGIGLLLGLLGRVAAIGIAVNMVVAILTTHLANGLFMNWSGAQKGEGYEYHSAACWRSRRLSWVWDRVPGRWTKPLSASQIRTQPR